MAGRWLPPGHGGSRTFSPWQKVLLDRLPSAVTALPSRVWVTVCSQDSRTNFSPAPSTASGIGPVSAAGLDHPLRALAGASGVPFSVFYAMPLVAVPPPPSS